MKYRLNKFHARTRYDADTTVVIPILIKDPISQILIKFEGLNSTFATTAHPISSVLKVELVDGSDVLFSLNGKECEALDFYHNHGNLRCNYNNILTGATPTRMLAINFGRYLWDKLYAFDPRAFKNPQLRIQLDIDAGGNAFTYNYLTCYANIFDDEILSLMGLMMTKQLKTHAVVDTTHYYTDLPIDYPYRALYYRVYAASLNPSALMDNLKISEDQDKRIPIDNTGLEILETLQQEYPAIREEFWFASAVAGRTLYITATQYVTIQGTTYSTEPQANNLVAPDGEGGNVSTEQLADGLNQQISVVGWIPHGVFEIPFGKKDDPEDWYDVRGIGSLRADMLGGDTGNASIFIQQVRPY